MSKAVAHPQLAQRLRRALLITLLALLILATLAAAISAYFEVSDAQDEVLLSIGRLVESDQIGAVTDNEVFDDDRFDDSAIRIWEFGRETRRSIRVRRGLRPGFHTVHEGHERWRIYLTRPNRSGQQLIVAQQHSISTEFAGSSAWSTAAPLLLLFLIAPVLVTLIVRHNFKPVNALASNVKTSDSLTLDFGDRSRIPEELLPFVEAIDTLLEKNDAFNQRQRRFIADAAHELRTPITALSLQLENIDSAHTAEQRNERQALLAHSLQRLQRLVGQLLDLARIQANQSPETSVVSLDALVREHLTDFVQLAEQKQIELGVDRLESVAVADTNHQLQHVIGNALSNAIKFAPDGGSVALDVYRDGQHAVFCVTDNGPGVPEDQLARLHEPFFRTADTASGLGAGLGLAICHEIAERLGGQLRLSNVAPSGFRFECRLPLVEAG